MPLTIISLNIQGLSSEKKRSLLKVWLAHTPHDVILLQELHITQRKSLRSLEEFFPEYNIYCSLGTWSAGGSLIMVKKKHSVVDSGTDSSGRLVFIKVIFNSTPVVIANIYAPAQITDRCEFFKELLLYIPSTKWLVLGGDFNCAPDPRLDRNHCGVQTDTLSYPILLHNVVHPLILTELFRSKYPRKITFSFHSEARDSHSRIDLFFSSEIVRKCTQDIYYSSAGLSDHDSLVLQINVPPRTGETSSRWICNPLVISRPSFMEKFLMIWDVFVKTNDFNTPVWWGDFKTSLTLLLQDEQTQMNKEKRYDLHRLQNEYRFRSHDTSEENLNRLESIRREIHRLLEEKIRINLSKHQEQNTKALSNLAKTRFDCSRSNQNRIPFLDHPSKGRVTDDNDILEVASNFYKELYDVKPIDTSCWNELFGDIPTLKQSDMNALEREITYSECYEALNTMPIGRTPGDDGITVEIWRKIFPIIGNHYVRMINDAKSSGLFHDGFLNALLTLLKKNNMDNGSMKNYRPLSLTNIDYKLLSKVLSSRLRKVLGSIIHLDQSCGIPGRTIQDNVHLIRSIISSHSMKRQPIGLIQWDQEKAYDRINHQYLLETLNRFGFGPQFIKWIRLLYTNATFQIKMNNALSKKISFNSGVRQGCPLSGGLYVLCIEPLLYSIRRNPRIPGVIPPGGQYPAVVQSIFNTDSISTVVVKLSAYADDVCTMAYGIDDEHETLKMFDNYNRCSGGKTNQNKTSILWISNWLEPPPFHAKIEREYATFLGIPIDITGKLPSNELSKVGANVKKLLGLWSSIRLSLLDRSIILRTFVLSKITYIFSSMMIPKKTIDCIQKDINRFFWHKRHPAMKIITCIGKKEAGGFALVHLQSMIKSYRIKCGLKVVLHTPRLWKFYAYQHSAVKLRPFAPWIWSNLVPHYEDINDFFNEVALFSAQWFKKMGIAPIKQDEPSIYWQLVNFHVFQHPVCYDRVPHLSNNDTFKIIHQSRLPPLIIEFWILLSNYGINTRSRFGKTTNEKQCFFCASSETLPHLFIQCPFFDELFNMMSSYVHRVSGLPTTRTSDEIIYLKIILSIKPKIIRRQVAYIIGNYLYAIYLYRTDMANGNAHRNCLKCLTIFQSNMKYSPYENG